MSSANIFGTLQLNDEVKIKRSNGKVHTATVQSFTEASGTVHVEWFENEDIKGKELPAASILSLNPQFQTQGMKEVKESNVENGRFDGVKLRYADPDLDDIMEESVEQSMEQSMEHSHELTPEPVAISKAQAQVEQDEKKLLEYCDDWLEWMAEQIKLVQEIRANADLVDSAYADYGPKLEQIFGTMMQEQQAISQQVSSLNKRNAKLQELLETSEKKSSRQPKPQPKPKQANKPRWNLYV